MMEEGNWTESYLSLGSNMGDRNAHLAHADYLLTRNPAIRILRRSSILDNPPLLVEEQPPFLNQIFRVETRLPPTEFLDTLKHYEKEIGRVKRIRFGPREIDLDILTYGDVRMDSEYLTIPHPALKDRDYLRILLAEFDLKPEDLLKSSRRVL